MPSQRKTKKDSIVNAISAELKNLKITLDMERKILSIVKRNLRAKKPTVAAAKSAYNFYSMEMSKTLPKTEKNRFKLIAKSWKELSDAGRAPYVELAAKDKLRYQADRAAAAVSAPAAVPEAPAAADIPVVAAVETPALPVAAAETPAVAATETPVAAVAAAETPASKKTVVKKVVKKVVKA